MWTEIYEQYTLKETPEVWRELERQRVGQTVYADGDWAEGYSDYRFDSATGLFYPAGEPVRQYVQSNPEQEIDLTIYTEFGAQLRILNATAVYNAIFYYYTVTAEKVSGGRSPGEFVRRFTEAAEAYPDDGDKEGYWYRRVGACAHPFMLFAKLSGRLRPVRSAAVRIPDGLRECLLGAGAGTEK